MRDLVARGLRERRGGRWELDVPRAGAEFSGCVPRPSLRAARAAIAQLPDSQRSSVGFAAVLWPELGTRALAGYEETLVADGLVVVEKLGLRVSQLALVRAAERALSAGLRRRAHLRAAELAQEPAARARHLFRAHARGRVRAALAAARERLRAGAPVDAALLYQIACAGLQHPFASSRAAVLWERAGDCLALAGQPVAARRQYGQALARGGAPGRIWQKIAKARWQEGRFELVLYRSLGDERQEAIAWNNLGAARYLAGEWDGALEAWVKLREKSQTLEEQLHILNNLGSLYRERGDLPKAKDLLQQALAKIQQAGGYARIEAFVRGNLGEVAAREGDVVGAGALYRETLEIAQRTGARDELVETERRLAELDLLQLDPAAADARATAALKLAVESNNLVEQGNLWRVRALAARAQGDGAAAAAAVTKARELLQGASALLELGRTDCVACALALDRSDPMQAATALHRPRAAFEKLGAAPDLREVERLQKDVEALERRSLSQVDALTQAAQRLAVRNGSAALLEDVLDEALFLPGAERGFVRLTEEGSAPRVAAVRGADASATLRISRTVADRVLRSGEVLAVADIVGREELSTRRSILDLGLRSVLCAPIRFGGRQLGILYVDSRRVGSLLSERDLGLLSAFAALAGSALENARLIDELRRKNELLAQMAHEAGAVKLALAKVDLAQVAAVALAGLESVAKEKSIEIALEVDDGLPPVLGDFDRLVHVVTKVVANAIRCSANGARLSVQLTRGDPLFTGRLGPRVEVEGSPLLGEAEPQPWPSVQIAVADHAGELRVESKPGQGTTFTVLLPGAP